MLGTAEVSCAVPLLAAASAFDVLRRRIPNAITVATLLTGAATSLWSGGLSSAASAIGAAVLVGGALLPVWRARALGGGDLKLAAAAAAWVGLSRVGAYALATAIVGGVAAVLCFALSVRAARREMIVNLKLAALQAMPVVPISQSGGRVSVPYGAAIAVAALWTIYRG